MTEKNEPEKIRCKACGSTLNYVRIKDGKRVCRRCGYISDSEPFGRINEGENYG